MEGTLSMNSKIFRLRKIATNVVLGRSTNRSNLFSQPKRLPTTKSGYILRKTV